MFSRCWWSASLCMSGKYGYKRHFIDIKTSYWSEWLRPITKELELTERCLNPSPHRSTIALVTLLFSLFNLCNRFWNWGNLRFALTLLLLKTCMNMGLLAEETGAPHFVNTVKLSQVPAVINETAAGTGWVKARTLPLRTSLSSQVAKTL